MAEASTVAEAPNGGAAIPQPKFFCHRCNVEISRVLPGFKCPRCNSGFIEELELQPAAAQQPSSPLSDDSSDDGDVEMVTSIGELLSQSLFSLRDSVASTAGEGAAAASGSSAEQPGEANNPSTRRRRQATGTFFPVRSTRRRTSSDRQMAPLENIIQEFIINLSGFDFDPAAMQAQGSPMFMYGNPGDYAFGRAGLDAIITQLLNQMDGTGPPPMAKDRIAQIPTVTVEQKQVDENLQCSVCWEDFKLSEPVRKLVCEHFYHTQCIVPWLQLHGTCPICRKALNDETASSNTNSGGTSSPETPAGGASSSSSSSSSTSTTSGQSGQSWLASATQTTPRLISNFIGSLTSALSGGSGSPSSSSPSGNSSSGASGGDAQAPGGSPTSRRRYNLRSHRSEEANQDGTDEDGTSSSSQQGPGRGRGRGRGWYFEDDYD